MGARRIFGLVIFLAVGWFVGTGIGASDHVDELDAILHEAADLTGVLAFSSPETPGHLVLIMDVHPFARSGSKFSEEVIYNFRLRSVDQVGSGGKVEVVLRDGDEHRISCRFSGDPQVMTCHAGSGVVTEVQVDDLGGGSSPDDLRAFAGLRSDPFFMDIPGYLETIALQSAVDYLPDHLQAYYDSSPPGEPPRVFRFSGKNTGQNTNILSLVLEVDAAAVFGPQAGPIFAVSAETLQLNS